MVNIELAWWYYIDNMIAGMTYQESRKLKYPFFQRIFCSLYYLQGLSKNLNTLWKQHFQGYKQQIPSYGCVILNENYDKILICVYLDDSNTQSKLFDFPKGKIDESESGIDCAVREVEEETQLCLDQDKINPNQFACVEIFDGKIV